MIIVWVLAILVSALAGFGFYRIGSPAWPVRRILNSADIAVIGTSLVTHAVPFGPVPGGLLGDARQHRRLAYNLMSERTAVEVLQAAVASGARTVLLEINPFVVDFPFQVEKNFNEDNRLTTARWLDGLSDQLHGGLWNFVGRSEIETDEPKDLQQTTNTANDETRRMFYPLYLREPREKEALWAAVAQARARGVKILLVAPPRARLAERWMGPEAVHELDLRLADLARELSLPLFQPGPNWPDALFVDNAHVNEHGRARFCRELAAWYGGLR